MSNYRSPDPSGQTGNYESRFQEKRLRISLVRICSVPFSGHTKEMESTSTCRSHGWLDSLAISMSIICAIHCLIPPILVVILPIIATSFWVHEHFHLWMLLFVVPSTSAAVLMGCRQHKDKWVLGLSIVGLLILTGVAFYETMLHSASLAAVEEAHCAHCASVASGHDHGETHVSASIFINVFGGLTLACAHVRNYLLCRRKSCDHQD